MRATQQLQYAIYGIFDLAFNGGSHPTRVQEISTRQGIPTRYLEQIFQKLRRGGLVLSKRGPGGGYVLARSPEDISLADVLVALQGVAVTRSDSRAPRAVGNPDFVWEMIQAGVDRTLRRWSVAEICREALRRGMERVETEPRMYYI